jgi:outer membrane immunogenic protein
MKKSFLLCLPLMAVGAPALAEAPAGFRLELMAGYDRPQARFADAATTPRKSLNSAFYGGGIGFDAAMGTAFSVGADAELTFSTADSSSQGGEISLNKDLYVGGRITGSVSDTFNVYAKAGYTNLEVDYRHPANAAAPRLAGHLNGVRGALGVQVVADEGAYYGFEGRYSDYEKGVTRKQAMLVVGTRF